MKNSYLEPYFPPVLLSDYIREHPNGLKRFQIYNLFRFFTALDTSSSDIAHFLRQMSDALLSEDAWQTISDYLEEDFYFSPVIRSDSYDAVLLYYSIWIMENTTAQRDPILRQIFAHYCPKILSFHSADSSSDLSFIEKNDAAFFGTLVQISCLAPARLSGYLPDFANLYREELHYTCEDFVLFDFMDAYFEISNCRSNPKFHELISTLATATLKAQDTTLEECTLEEGLNQLNHPASQFAGLCRYGALAISDPEPPEISRNRMQHLLDYAVTCELRRNLFDFHLEGDSVITLDNWKEKLRWYHVQYDSAYAQAISSFYMASLSRKMLKTQFLENLRAF